MLKKKLENNERKLCFILKSIENSVIQMHKTIRKGILKKYGIYRLFSTKTRKEKPG